MKSQEIWQFRAPGGKHGKRSDQRMERLDMYQVRFEFLDVRIDPGGKIIIASGWPGADTLYPYPILQLIGWQVALTVCCQHSDLDACLL
jgi:hypothetical protein